MQTKKKVLFVTTVGNFLRLFEWNDAEILQRMGYEVHYAADFAQLDAETEKLYQKGNIVLHPLPICRSPLRVRKNISAFRQLKKLIQKEGFLLLHCHTPMGGVLGRLAAFFCGGRKPYVIYTAHGFHFYQGAPLFNWLLYFPAEYLLARLTDCLITVNAEDYQRALRFPLRGGGRAERIPGVGLSLEKLGHRYGRCPEIRKQLRRKHGIPAECFYVLTAGELNRNKNQKVLIQAVAMLRQKKVQLGICGAGPYRERLERLAGELGVAARVSFFGYRDDLWELLTAADAFAFPSIREGFAIAPLEALAAGLPLITSKRRDSREYMRQGENGLVCKENTAEEYAEAIQLLLGHRGLCEKLSKEGEKTAAQYALPKTARIMEQIYAECCRIPWEARGRPEDAAGKKTAGREAAGCRGKRKNRKSA